MAGLYIHIPFCKQACNYCDFHFSVSFKLKQEIIDSLKEEMILRRNEFENLTVSSVYFGGGTPSILTKDQINDLLNHIYDYFDICQNAEITLEANPDDIDHSMLQELKLTRINRLSIGIQSFVQKDLDFMNRAHSSSEAIASVKSAKDVGFENISIDLIYGVPGMSNKDWRYNISLALSLGVNHISSYALTVEEKTPLYHHIKNKKVSAIDEDQTIEQFQILIHEMEKNQFEHYEISNFCRNNNYSKHNSLYWENQPYMGIGPSSHSYNGTERMWNVSNNIKYINAIKRGVTPQYRETLTISQRYNEYVMTKLRTSWGCDTVYIAHQFSSYYKKHFIEMSKYYVTQGYLFVSGTNYKLTNEGKLIADRISSELFVID